MAGSGIITGMYYVYILSSLVKNRHYIGHASDLSARLNRHNTGQVKSTKPYMPWEIIYSEEYNSKQDAYMREMQIKSYKGGRALKVLLTK